MRLKIKNEFICEYQNKSKLYMTHVSIKNNIGENRSLPNKTHKKNYGIMNGVEMTEEGNAVFECSKKNVF